MHPRFPLHLLTSIAGETQMHPSMLYLSEASGCDRSERFARAPAKDSDRRHEDRSQGSVGVALPRTRFRPDTRLDLGGRDVESDGGRDGRGSAGGR